MGGHTKRTCNQSRTRSTGAVAFKLRHIRPLGRSLRIPSGEVGQEPPDGVPQTFAMRMDGAFRAEAIRNFESCKARRRNYHGTAPLFLERRRFGNHF
jgi:hypothetical protein